MEQVEVIPFSGLIAGILLYKRECTSVELVNILSKLEGNGIVVDDENDDLEQLFCCVEVNANFHFCLKDGVDYDTILSSGIAVCLFLKRQTTDRILSILNENLYNFLPIEQNLQMKFFEKETEIVKKEKNTFLRKRKILTKGKDVCQHIALENKKNSFRCANS